MEKNAEESIEPHWKTLVEVVIVFFFVLVSVLVCYCLLFCKFWATTVVRFGMVFTPLDVSTQTIQRKMSFVVLCSIAVLYSLDPEATTNPKTCIHITHRQRQIQRMRERNVYKQKAYMHNRHVYNHSFQRQRSNNLLCCVNVWESSSARVSMCLCVCGHTSVLHWYEHDLLVSFHFIFSSIYCCHAMPWY